jgi:hypothetical protein
VLWPVKIHTYTHRFKIIQRLNIELILFATKALIVNSYKNFVTSFLKPYCLMTTTDFATEYGQEFKRWILEDLKWLNFQKRNNYEKRLLCDISYNTMSVYRINPTWHDLGSNPACRDGKPSTNHLNYGMMLNLNKFGRKRFPVLKPVNAVRIPLNYFRKTRFILFLALYFITIM